MISAWSVVLALVTGLLLGAIFFGGLWWTVRRAFSSTQPALWFVSSMFLRTGIVLAGFYFIARGRWESLLVCLLAFVMSRIIVTRLARLAEKPCYPAQVASHAP